MRNRFTILLLATLTIGSMPSRAALIDPLTDASVIVRTYDRTALPPRDRVSALATATAALGAAGLDVEWRACDAVFVRSAGDPCAAPLGANELAIRFVRLPALAGHGDQVRLGYSLVDTRARAGSLATIYVDRVVALARTSAIDAGILLGRAIAHEIGHLLLGTRRHAAAGLMRAVWSPEALRGSRSGDWLFTSVDGRAMRDAVRTRAVQQMAAHLVWGD